MVKYLYTLTIAISAPIALNATEIAEEDLKEEAYYFLQYGSDESDYTKDENFVALLAKGIADKYFYTATDFEKHLEGFFLQENKINTLKTHSYPYQYDVSKRIYLYEGHLNDFFEEETINKEHILDYIKKMKIENVYVLDSSPDIKNKDDLQWKPLKVFFAPKQDEKPDQDEQEEKDEQELKKENEETTDPDKTTNTSPKKKGGKSDVTDWILPVGGSALLISFVLLAYRFMSQRNNNKDEGDFDFSEE